MKSQEKQLINLFRELDEAKRGSVLDFARFLREQVKEQDVALPEPQWVAPKPGETVVGAIKRLSASYPMLDKAKMLDETSTLVTQHVMQGRNKLEVIAELEQVFALHYERLKTLGKQK
ncbi:MAG: Crp/Fnr family transcriptional regulator [Gammaproteobacteria bacterium]|nr:Crp/Fnr family transcriptional regulator [Gammaproteobacteria bacterium]